MSDNAGSSVAAVLAAVFGASAVILAGYYGFIELRTMLQAQQTETRSVIVELKTETIDEIKKLGGSVSGNDGMSSMQGDAIASGLGELTTMVEDIRQRQANMAGQLSAIPAPEVMEPAMPTTVGDTMSETVYFPLAVSEGENIDSQIAEMTPRLAAFIGVKTCTADVSGYSDTIGNDSANLNISRERAQYVAAKLAEQGLTIGEVTGWGERRLAVHTGDGVHHDKNRRVVVDVTCAAEPVANDAMS